MSVMTRVNRWTSLIIVVAAILGLFMTGNRLVADDAADQAASAAEKAEALRDLAVAEAAQIEAAAEADKLKEQDAKRANTKPAEDEKPAVEGEIKINLGAVVKGLFGGGNDQPQRGQRNMIGIPIAEDEIAEPDNDPQVLQFLQMHRPKLTTELRFVRLICSDLDPELRPKVRKAADACLKDFVVQLARQQKQMQRGIAINGVNPWNADAGNPIREAISASLKEVLTDEQMARYQDEVEKRRQIRQRAVILNAISMLDGRLFLEDDQRKKIEESLKSRWQDNWEKWNMIGMYGGQYLPQIPDQCVAPHLSNEQKKVWNGLMKVEFGWWSNDDGNGNPDDDQWWGVPSENQGAIGVFGGIMVQPAAVMEVEVKVDE